MSESISGVVSRVSQKDLGLNKWKKQTYRLGVQLDDVEEWYNIGFSSKSADALGLIKDQEVSFAYTDNDYGHNIDEKSVKAVRRSAASPAKAPPRASDDVGATTPQALRPARPVGAPAGVTVGMALNNATLLIANGVIKADGSNVLDKIERLARAIIGISQRIEQGEPLPSPKPEPEVEEPAPEEPEPEEAPAPPPRRDAAKAKPAAAKAAPPPPPARAKPKAPPPPPAADGFDDDDIPFK